MNALTFVQKRKLARFSLLALGLSALPTGAMIATGMLTEGMVDASADFWTSFLLLCSTSWVALPSYLDEYPWSAERRRQMGRRATTIGLTSIAVVLTLKLLHDLKLFAEKNGFSGVPATNVPVNFLVDNHRWVCVTLGVCSLCLALRTLLTWHRALLRKTSIQLLWHHQAQFAGVYLALDAGLFEERGLDVTIRPGGPDEKPVRALLSGEVEFAIVNASNVVVSRSLGEEIVCILELMETSGIVFFHRRSIDLSSLSNLKGKRIGYIEDYEEEFMLNGMLRSAALSTSDVTLVRGENAEVLLQMFLDDQIDVSSGHICNEPNRANAKGLKISSVRRELFGAPESGDVLAAMDAFVELQPDVARAFRDGLTEGWRLAQKDNVRAIAATMNHLPADRQTVEERVHQEVCLRSMLVSIFKTRFPRRVRTDLWAKQVDFLYNASVITKRVDVDSLICRL